MWNIPRIFRLRYYSLWIITDDKFSYIAGLYSTHGKTIWFPVRIGSVQMATMAASADGKAAYHLGVGDEKWFIQ